MRANNPSGPPAPDTFQSAVIALLQQDWWWLIVVGFLLALLGLAFEWQRRRTLVAVMRAAPGGSVVVMKRGRGGPALWVRVGSGQRGEASEQVQHVRRVWRIRRGR